MLNALSHQTRCIPTEEEDAPNEKDNDEEHRGDDADGKSW